jgi:hypothetical protein
VTDSFPRSFCRRTSIDGKAELWDTKGVTETPHTPFEVRHREWVGVPKYKTLEEAEAVIDAINADASTPEPSPSN